MSGLIPYHRDVGKLIFHEDDLHPRGEDMVFPVGSFPQAPPPDTRPKKIATKRMLWRHSGALAAAVGRPYFEHDEPNLIPFDEWVELQDGGQ